MTPTLILSTAGVFGGRYSVASAIEMPCQPGVWPRAMISGGVTCEDASNTSRSTVSPISELPMKKLIGSNVTRTTAPDGAAGSNGSGQSTKRTMSPLPDRSMRTTPEPTILTLLRVVSGSRCPTSAGADGTSVAGRSPGTVMAIRSTTRSTNALAPAGSRVWPAPGTARVRTSRNGRPALSPGTSTSQLRIDGKPRSEIGWMTPEWMMAPALVVDRWETTARFSSRAARSAGMIAWLPGKGAARSSSEIPRFAMAGSITRGARDWGV